MSVPDRIADKIDAIAFIEGRKKYAVVERALDLYRQQSVDQLTGTESG